MANEIVNATGSKFIPLNELLMQDSILQITLGVLVVGIIAIFWQIEKYQDGLIKKKSATLDHIQQNL